MHGQKSNTIKFYRLQRPIDDNFPSIHWHAYEHSLPYHLIENNWSESYVNVWHNRIMIGTRRCIENINIPEYRAITAPAHEATFTCNELVGGRLYHECKTSIVDWRKMVNLNLGIGDDLIGLSANRKRAISDTRMTLESTIKPNAILLSLSIENFDSNHEILIHYLGSRNSPIRSILDRISDESSGFYLMWSVVNCKTVSLIFVLSRNAEPFLDRIKGEIIDIVRCPVPDGLYDYAKGALYLGLNVYSLTNLDMEISSLVNESRTVLPGVDERTDMNTIRELAYECSVLKTINEKHSLSTVKAKIDGTQCILGQFDRMEEHKLNFLALIDVEHFFPFPLCLTDLKSSGYGSGVHNADRANFERLIYTNKSEFERDFGQIEQSSMVKRTSDCVLIN